MGTGGASGRGFARAVASALAVGLVGVVGTAAPAAAGFTDIDVAVHVDAPGAVLVTDDETESAVVPIEYRVEHVAGTATTSEVELSAFEPDGTLDAELAAITDGNDGDSAPDWDCDLLEEIVFELDCTFVGNAGLLGPGVVPGTVTVDWLVGGIGEHDADANVSHHFEMVELETSNNGDVDVFELVDDPAVVSLGTSGAPSVLPVDGQIGGNVIVSYEIVNEEDYDVDVELTIGIPADVNLDGVEAFVDGEDRQITCPVDNDGDGFLGPGSITCALELGDDEEAIVSAGFTVFPRFVPDYSANPELVFDATLVGSELLPIDDEPVIDAFHLGLVQPTQDLEVVSADVDPDVVIAPPGGGAQAFTITVTIRDNGPQRYEGVRLSFSTSDGVAASFGDPEGIWNCAAAVCTFDGALPDDGSGLTVDFTGSVQETVGNFHGRSVVVSIDDGFQTIPDTATGNDFEQATFAYDRLTVAQPDSYATDEDTALVRTAAAGVLANDSDADGGLTATVTDGPDHAAAFTLNPDGSFSYTPTADFNGSDSFTYQAQEAFQGAPATVSIDVGSVDDLVIGVADVYPTTEDTPLNVLTPTGVLANDVGGDGTGTTALLVAPPEKGVLALLPSGGFSYVPPPNFVGLTFFTYRPVEDGIAGAVTTAVVVVQAAPGTDLEQFVADTYLVLLGRQPEPGGLAFWVAQLQGGMSRQAFAAQVLALPEARGLLVRQAYQDVLGRQPEPGGLAFWSSVLASGRPVQEIERALIASEEFRVGAGATNTGVVGRIYLVLLGRNPDAGGLQFWSGRLDAGTSPATLAAAIQSTDEGVVRQLTVLYQRVLVRNPDPEERAAEAPRLRTVDRCVLLSELVASGEFFALSTVG